MVPNHQPVIVFWSLFFSNIRILQRSSLLPEKTTCGRHLGQRVWWSGEAVQRCHHFAPSGRSCRSVATSVSGSFVDVRKIPQSWENIPKVREDGLNRFQSSYHPLLFYTCLRKDSGGQVDIIIWYHHIRKLKLPKVTKIQYMTCGAKYSLFHFF